jgi:branched-chain amino acid transport system substrate-binding protein
VLGRKVEMLAEDSVNPATAVTKAQKLIERDKVNCIIGEISSASALAIAQQAGRYKAIFINTARIEGPTLQSAPDCHR